MLWTPGIESVEIPLPPLGIECTAGLSEMGRTNLIPLLFQALCLCEQPFGALLKLLSPDFVIHDMTIYWTPRVAAKSGIPTVNFAVINMTSMTFLTGQHWHGLPQIPTAEDLCVLPMGFPSFVVRNCFKSTSYDCFKSTTVKQTKNGTETNKNLQNKEQIKPNKNPTSGYQRERMHLNAQKMSGLHGRTRNFVVFSK